MATKLSNTESRIFHMMIDNKSTEEIARRFVKNIINHDDINHGLKLFMRDFNTAKTLFDKVKFFDKKEYYAINGWGYDQTNYENLVVFGEADGCVICAISGQDYYVYAIRKSKYVNKEYAKIDSNEIRTTSWEQPYSDKKIVDNMLHNAYYGH